MNTSNKLLSVLAILTLSACQGGRVAGKSSSSTSQLTGATPAPTTGLIEAGNISGGINLQVDTTPTPAPAPSIAVPVPVSTSSITHQVGFIFAQLLSMIGTDAFAITGPSTLAPPALPIITLPDTFMLRDYNDYIGQLQTVLGSNYVTLQNLYVNYAAMAASNPSTPVPDDLQKIAHLQFTALSGAIAHAYIPLVNLFNQDFGFITKGNQSWSGKLIINGANSSTLGGKLKELVGHKIAQTGLNTLKVFGGNFVSGTGTYLNRNFTTITLGSGTFSMSTSTTAFATSSSYVALKPILVDSAAVSTFGVSAYTYQGKQAFVAQVNTLGKVVGFYSLNLLNGVITTLSVPCTTTRAALFGLSCNLAISSGPSLPSTSISGPSLPAGPAPATTTGPMLISE
jgi:hypothetical protein